MADESTEECPEQQAVYGVFGFNFVNGVANSTIRLHTFAEALKMRDTILASQRMGGQAVTLFIVKVK